MKFSFKLCSKAMINNTKKFPCSENCVFCRGKYFTVCVYSSTGSELFFPLSKHIAYLLQEVKAN